MADARKPWTPKDVTLLIRLRGDGLTMGAIGYQLQRSPESVAWKVKQLISSGQLQPASHHVNRKYQLPGRIDLPQEPDHDHFFRVKGDTLNISDIHFPYPNRALFAYFLKVALKQKIRTCLIPGDFLNLDSMGRFASMTRGNFEFEKEVVQAKYFLDQLLGVFDTIYISMGNHEDRFFKRMDGLMGHEMFFKIIHDEIGKRIHVSSYKYMELMSGGKRWLVGHPDAFSGQGGKTPAETADILQANIITGHNHAWGVQMSKSGKYVGIDHGCACDPVKVEYYAKGFSKFPRWQNGFSMVRNGFGYAFNLTQTNWKEWV